MNKIFKRFTLSVYLHRTFSFEDGFYQITPIPSPVFVLNRNGFRGTNMVMGLNFLIWDAGLIVTLPNK
jgi:hypothetical protein